MTPVDALVLVLLRMHEMRGDYALHGNPHRLSVDRWRGVWQIRSFGGSYFRSDSPADIARKLLGFDVTEEQLALAIDQPCDPEFPSLCPVCGPKVKRDA